MNKSKQPNDNPCETLSPDQGLSPRKAVKSQTRNWLLFFAIGFVLICLVLPAARRNARPAAYRMQCSNNLKQIGLALHNYENKYGQLPPAFTLDGEGKRLHSWRTLLLPFLEQADLYSKVDLTKSWDDPAHDAVRQVALSVFRCPSSNTKQSQTIYLAVVCVKSSLQPNKGRAMTEFVDRLSDTVVVYEAEPSQAVHWMSPEDADEKMFLSLHGKSQSSHEGGRHALFADGHVQFIASEISPEILRGMITFDGGEESEKRE